MSGLCHSSPRHPGLSCFVGLGTRTFFLLALATGPTHPPALLARPKRGTHPQVAGPVEPRPWESWSDGLVPLRVSFWFVFILRFGDWFRGHVSWGRAGGAGGHSCGRPVDLPTGSADLRRESLGHPHLQRRLLPIRAPVYLRVSAVAGSSTGVISSTAEKTARYAELGLAARPRPAAAR